MYKNSVLWNTFNFKKNPITEMGEMEGEFLYVFDKSILGQIL